VITLEVVQLKNGLWEIEKLSLTMEELCKLLLKLRTSPLVSAWMLLDTLGRAQSEPMDVKIKMISSSILDKEVKFLDQEL